MGHVMLHLTHGTEEVERASLAFIVANAARNSGQDATVLLTIEGVRVATKGYTDGAQYPGLSPLSELLQQFLANGGKLWACGICTKVRNLTEADMIPGAQIVGAAAAVEALVNGAQTLSW